MSGSSSNSNYAYARNSVLTVAEMTMTGMTAWGSYVASAGTNGDIRLIDVNFDGNDCLDRSEEHTSELQSLVNLVCRLLLEKKKQQIHTHSRHTTNTNIC